MAKRRGAMPAGSGAVRCTECGAVARADGTGRPIILRHKPGCPIGDELDLWAAELEQTGEQK